ncbi:helix-turn-helix domain-containing protein [Frankia sp. AgB32]|uniref:helix-turn-helix domain-containing protein n=1 Tax=Frankia sp. AgB32 TaxID=631119 RepID=UPI00200C7104|nr:helix-turn-helix domain-containing protein [Frankia sp. AgB32]MCK9897133.1 helix-turn-helix domain-containing protein [Frankia sp. AgB32]
MLSAVAVTFSAPDTETVSPVLPGGYGGRVVMRRAADPRLDSVVAGLGYSRGQFAHARELALPTGGVQLLISLSTDVLEAWDADDPRVSSRTGAAALQGPTDRPILLDPATQREIVWVAFRPGGAWPFFPVDGADLPRRLVDLGDLWGRTGSELRERLRAAAGPDAALALLERTLLDQAIRPVEADPAVRRAAEALHAGTPVAATADLLGWTPRRLNRQFTARIGLAPKRFSRVRRFQRLLHAAAAAGHGADPDWARLAVDCGYYDQAHLINDFRALSGLTPGAWRPRSPDAPNHVPRGD